MPVLASIQTIQTMQAMSMNQMMRRLPLAMLASPSSYVWGWDTSWGI